MNVILWTLGALGALVGLQILASALAWWRYRFPPPDLERLVLPLPTAGHYIALYHLPPEVRRFSEPVVLAHGLGVNQYNMDFIDDGEGRDRSSLARALARAGFDVWLLATRGHGGASVPRGAVWTGDDEVEEDVPAAVLGVLDATRAERLFWVGHSWGGTRQLIYLARGLPGSDRVAGVVAVGSPGSLASQPRLQPLARRVAGALAGRGWPFPWRAAALLVLPWMRLIALFPPVLLPSQAVLTCRLLMRLFASVAEDVGPGFLRHGLGWMEAGGFHRPGRPEEVPWSRIRTPTYLVAGENDLISPPDSVRYLAERIGSDDLTFEIAGRGSGFSVDYGHGGLLLAREAPDEVFPRIVDWLRVRATANAVDGDEAEGDTVDPPP